VVICPSNPYLSVDPILALSGVRDAVADLDAPIIAVSPLIGGKALKGPLSKLMDELGKPDGNHAIAAHYAGLVDHLVIDAADEADAAPLRETGLCVTLSQTLMRDAADRKRLALEVLGLVGGATE
jgi:LPPG:FO 2-phospho-L-lactate transferase